MKRVGSRVAGWLAAVAVAAMLSPVSMSFAAVNNDEVTSVKLKEADGTSGQNTNSGSGVKTGHIQDGAVTDAKITGPISTSKLNVGTSAGTVAAGDHSHVISTDNIADGAVTDIKITGTISGSKLGAHGHNASDLVGTVNASNLPVGTASGTVAAGDHGHDSAYQKKYANVVVVAKSGGDYIDPVAAMNFISDASSTNPYLIKIMPGVYDIGRNTLVTKSYVDIDGSGENNTIIKGSGSFVRNTVISTLVFNPSQNVQISNLSLHNYGGVDALVSQGLWNTDCSGTFKLTNTTINVGGGVIHNEVIRAPGGIYSHITINVLTESTFKYAFSYENGETISPAPMIVNSRINSGNIYYSTPNYLLRMVNVLYNGDITENILKLNVYDSNLNLR